MRAAQGTRDSNHADVAKWYEELYCLVHDTHAMGGGFPDMLVRISTRAGQVLALVEVKSADGTLRPSQERFLRDWGGGCVEVVQTRDDVFAHVERVRSRCKVAA
jgi:VRR-NUC domain